MRELIRPTLFMVARLGLFLAVVAWVVGQWWAVFAEAPAGTGGVVKEGWVCCFVYAMPRDWCVRTGAAGEIGTTEHFFNPPSNVETEAWAESGFSVGGVTVVRNPMGTWIAFRHWLVVTMFALFYGVLKWVYRKRGKELDASCTST